MNIGRWPKLLPITTSSRGVAMMSSQILRSPAGLKAAVQEIAIAGNPAAPPGAGTKRTGSPLYLVKIRSF
jgi:hypothetical protein